MLVMLLLLGGLAMSDPTVSAEAITAGAVITGVIIGSLIPDVDTVLKLRNNAVYIRHHRGITHSVPAVILWPLIITLFLSFLFPGSDFLHVWAWTFLAVFLHVFVDIFNSYGTQALRPFSKKWVAIGVINTFDPFIFTLHIIAIGIWAFGVNPFYPITIMYIIIFVYYLLRFALKAAVKNAVAHTIPDANDIIIAPTMRFLQWRVAASSENCHYVGRAYGRSITIYDRFTKDPLPELPEVKAALQDNNIKAFTAFSPIYRWEISKMGDLCEVRLIDLRYRSKGYYPFVAVAHIDSDMTVVNSYTGWIFSEEKLNKKLNFIPHS